MDVTLLADADPVPLVLAWLREHEALATVLGGPGRVGAYSEPPYPRLRVHEVPGGTVGQRSGELLHAVTSCVQLEALGAGADAPGVGALKRIVMVALGAVAELPGQPYVSGPVITGVRYLAGSGGPMPDIDGRLRWVAKVLVSSHAGPG
ncbi:hypothetical protein ABT352_33400 [Streptosporangium sp. NPDC000563]|uniref:hypothetical protein n=1 Tax=Streptosporangium sp. NPDC000563 TaxID=3154366 RepID=UPI003325BF83